MIDYDELRDLVKHVLFHNRGIHEVSFPVLIGEPGFHDGDAIGVFGRFHPGWDSEEMPNNVGGIPLDRLDELADALTLDLGDLGVTMRAWNIEQVGRARPALEGSIMTWVMAWLDAYRAEPFPVGQAARAREAAMERLADGFTVITFPPIINLNEIATNMVGPGSW